MEAKTYLLLLSLNKDNAKLGKAVLAKIKRDIDPNAGPLWIDSRGVGVFIASPDPAWKVMQRVLPQDDLTTREDRTSLQDLLLLQIGPDFQGTQDSKAIAWMNSRYPKH